VGWPRQLGILATFVPGSESCACLCYCRHLTRGGEEEIKGLKSVTVEDEPKANSNTYSAPAVAPQLKSESTKEEPISAASTPADDNENTRDASGRAAES
jgi:hypothetical protein